MPRLVDQPYLYPGRCILTGRGGPEAGPYVDLETEDDAGCRRYLAVEAVNELIPLVNGCNVYEREALEEIARQYEQLQAEHEALKLKHGQLEAAVATTLAVGCVFDKKTMKPKLRKPRGAALVPDLDEEVSEDAVDQEVAAA